MLNLARIKIVFPFLSLVKSVYAANFFCFVVEPFIFFSSAVPLTSFAFLLLGRLLLWSVLFSREGDVASVYIKPTSLCRRRMWFRFLLFPSGLRELSACYFFFNVICLPLFATGSRRWICVVYIVVYICCLSWFLSGLAFEVFRF